MDNSNSWIIWNLIETAQFTLILKYFMKGVAHFTGVAHSWGAGGTFMRGIDFRPQLAALAAPGGLGARAPCSQDFFKIVRYAGNFEQILGSRPP